MTINRPKVSAEICVTVYANPLRLSRLFESFDLFGWPSRTPLVFEDPSSEEIAQTYRSICYKRNVEYDRSPEWGCMQGIAKYAIEHTMADWFVYLPDDVLPTPGALDNVLRWLPLLPYWVGAVQIPYWNYEEIVDRHRQFMYEGNLGWLATIPLNPHWMGPALYINCNGAGLAIKRSAYDRVGGFDTRTWSFDEDIAARIWLETNDLCVVCIPGPPWVHQGGASTPDQFKFGHAHLKHATEEAWKEIWGMGRVETGQEIRKVMEERGRKYKWPVR